MTNVVLTGVGGQGIVLASTVLVEAAFEAGYDVKANEVHGMAQRGGSVVAQVRFGEKVFSPLVPLGQADFLVALEEVEALRYAGYLRADGVAIVNRRQIVPVTVSAGDARYPEDVDKRLRARFGGRLVLVEGERLAREAGNVRTENVVLLGVLSRFLEIPLQLWEEVIARLAPKRAVEANLRAFSLGREVGLFS